MLNFIQSQLFFYLSMIFVLFVPGYFLLLAIEARKKLFSPIEKFVFSFGFSIIVVDFMMILISRAGIALNKSSIILGIVIFFAICFVIHRIIRRRQKLKDNAEDKIFNFSKNQKILIMILLFLTIFIKTAYLKNSIFPTSTDLGHHMYWTKVTVETGKIPVYQESDIVQIDGKYQISEPQKIADFIIGEHLIFAAIHLLSGASLISYFPSLILFLTNIMAILAIFILTLRLFESYPFGKNAGIISLLLIGPVYAISSSQAKFASGGVIGNTIGNLLIPIALYFLFRAFKEKKSLYLSLSIISAVGLAYTHHLSAFIFLFVFAFIAVIFSILNWNSIASYAKEWARLILKPQVIIIFVLAILFFIFAYTPTYVDTKAVGTAVGGPSKETRAGLTFNQLKTTAGEARMVLGLIGIAVLLAAKKRKSYENTFALGWCVSILVMSLWPQWLLLDLPSARIANYISFPLAISGAFALAYTFDKLKNSDGKYFVSSKILVSCFLLLVTFTITSGFYDNSQSINTQSNYQKAMQTLDAAEYAGKNSSQTELAVKDHNYITADSWMKLSFMNGYNYPFSRGLLRRYEDTTKPREMCTLWMISTPNTEQGQKCFNDLGVRYVLVNPQFDSAQFQKSEEFWQVYTGKEINVYYRK